MRTVHTLGFLALIPFAAVGCGDTQYNGAATELGAPTVDTDAIAADLAGLTWSRTEYTAAVCGNDGTIWTFHEEGQLTKTSWSDRYPEDTLEHGCDFSSRDKPGYWSIGEDGVMLLQVEDEPDHLWQIHLDEVPRPNRRGESIQYDPGTFGVKRFAFHQQDGAGLRYASRHQGVSSYAYAWQAFSISLDFAQPLSTDTPNDCDFDVTIDVEALEEDHQSTLQLDGPCRLEETGVEDWVAIFHANPPPPEDRPSISGGDPYNPAQSQAGIIGNRFVGDMPIVMFRKSASTVLVFGRDPDH